MDLTEEAVLRRQREELFALLLEEEGLAASPARPLTRRERREALPLSFAQQRLVAYIVSATEKRPPTNGDRRATSADRPPIAD
jgi:hypothetical protein